MQVFKRSILTGFVGGFFWCFIGTVLAYFKFTVFTPKALLVQTWLRTAWSAKWMGDLLALFIAGVLSILAAVLYFALLRKLANIWIGAAYGWIIWCLVFFLALPLAVRLPNVSQLNQETIVTTLCLYTLYGVFIGFSVAYDYQDTLRNSKVKRKM